MKHWLQKRHLRWTALLFVMAMILASAATTPAAQHRALGLPEDERLLAGFWPRPEGRQEPFRWTDGDSVIRLYGYESTAAVLAKLRMTGLQSPDPTAVPLTLQSHGRELAQFGVAPAWRVYHVLAAPQDSGWKTPELRLLSPAQRPGPQDGRELGVAVAEVELDALGGRLWLPFFERAAFFATLLGLLFYLLWRLEWGALAWAVTPAVALLLLAVSLADPALLSYLLPPLWRLMALAALALAAVHAVQVLEPRVAASRRWAGVGVGLALAGQLLLRPRQSSLWPLLLGGALLACGVVLIAAAASPFFRRGETSGERPLSGRLLLGGCFLLALALRLYQLDMVPFGMWRDEARHGLLALRILNDSGFRPIYVPDAPIRVDLPALLFYLQALPIALLGPTVGAARLVSALAGSLTVFPIYLLARRLWSPTAGLLAAFLLAVSSWHVALSRFASPAVLDPLFTLSGLALLTYALDQQEQRGGRRRLAAAALAGVCVGLALYTYHTGRLMPAAAAALIVYYLGRSRAAWRRAAPLLAVFAVATVLVASPLAYYMLSSPEAFNRRINQISTFAADELHSSPAQGFEENIVRYALMWNVEGEHNARHHVPFVPLLDLLSGLLFAAGAVLLLRSWRRRRAALLPLTLLVLGLLPGVLSSDAPHALRSVDAIAPSVLLAAAGAASLLGVFRARWPQWRVSLAAGLGAAAIAALNIWVYFGHMPYDPAVWGKFEYTAETAIGSYVQGLSTAAPIYITQPIARSDVAQYLAYYTPLHVLKPSDPAVKLPSGALLLVPADAREPERRWARHIAGPRVVPRPMRPFPGTDKPTFWLYQIP